MTEIIRMVVVLSLIAGVCSAALTSANILLGPQVERQTDLYIRGPALERLFNEPAEQVLNNKVTFPGEVEDIPIFFKSNGDEVTMIAVEAIGRGGFGGDLKIMVGIDLAKNSQAGMEVVSHSETPGLGARIEEISFRKQWQGLPIDKPIALTTDGGAIDAISGASTTSQAAVNGTNEVLTFVQMNKDKILEKIAKL